jgi:hypothetical protein
LGINKDWRVRVEKDKFEELARNVPSDFESKQRWIKRFVRERCICKDFWFTELLLKSDGLFAPWNFLDEVLCQIEYAGSVSELHTIVDSFRDGAVHTWLSEGDDLDESQDTLENWALFDAWMNDEYQRCKVSDEAVHAWFRRKLRDAPRTSRDVYQFEVTKEELAKLQVVDSRIDRRKMRKNGWVLIFPGVPDPRGPTVQDGEHERDADLGCFYMPARYDGLCDACRKPYAIGEKVAYFMGARSKHFDCRRLPSTEDQLLDRVARLESQIVELVGRVK